MSKQENNWKPFTKNFDQELHEALLQQHQASQLIAMVGRHLIPQQADDSNTNMEYDSEKGLLIGNPLSNGISVAIELSSLYLKILDKDGKVLKQFALEGKTKDDAFKFLKVSLLKLDIDVSHLKNELHYKIPKHPIDKGATFAFDETDPLIENAIYRHNAKIILNKISEIYKLKEAIKIWPHHFDTGSFIPVSYNEKGDLSQSIGLGLAIPDSMVDEPYYYLSFWSAEPIKELENPDELTVGEWMIPTWNGAVLKLSDIMKAKSAQIQHQIVLDFYVSGFNILKKYFKF